MSLIKAKEDLKRHFSSVDNDYSLESLLSFINDAEQDILVPWIGYEFYSAINTAYNANNLAGKQLEVFVFLQKAVVHLAFLLASDSGSLRIGDSGFYVVSTPSNKPVSDKKMAEFKKGRRESGYRALEQAGIFLEKNIAAADLVLYKNSEERAQRIAYFIYNSVDFTRYYKKVNNSAYLFNQLADALDRAERKFIAPLLGIDFFTDLKDKLSDNSFDDDEKKLLPLIKRALANYTMAEGLPGLSVEFDGTSLLIGSQPAYGNSENIESKAAAKPEDIAGLVTKALEAGESELNALQDYLVANAASYPGYTPPEQTGDVDINDPSNKIYFV